jgi:uncharacterized protein (DUF952 family)
VTLNPVIERRTFSISTRIPQLFNHGEQGTMSGSHHPSTCYRLMSASELETFKSSGLFTGSPLDVKDGFIHMSTSVAVRDTANIYFKGCDDTMLVKVDLTKLPADADLRWDWVEKRRVHFPHLYGKPLPYTAVSQVWGPLAKKEGSGAFELPDEIP